MRACCALMSVLLLRRHNNGQTLGMRDSALWLCRVCIPQEYSKSWRSKQCWTLQFPPISSPIKSMETREMTERAGHCLCGAVTFRLASEPLVTRICWCRDCQHISANGTVNMLVPTEALSISGDLSEYTSTAHSGNAVTRQFCPSCGSQIFAKSSARPHMRVVRAGNLDDPSSIQPHHKHLG